MKSKLLFQIMLLLFTKELKSQYVNPQVLSALPASFTAPSPATLTSVPTLNKFFATKIGTYLSEASDLSLSKAYAVLDNADGKLFIGGTFNKNNSSAERTKFIFTAGVKANIKDGFAKILDEDGFNNDIGINLKFTFFGRGSIWFDANPAAIKRTLVTNKRLYLENKLLSEFDEKITKEGFNENHTGNTASDWVSNIGTYIRSESENVRKKFSEEEAEYISDEKLFNVAHSWWISTDVYIPFTKSEFDIVNDLSERNFKTEKYKPYELNISYTNFWEKNLFIGFPLILPGTTLLTFKGSVLANNSVSAELIDAYTYDKYLEQDRDIDTVFAAKLKTQSVYLGKFENFVTTRLSGRLVYMPVSFMGISAAFEKSFGKTNDINWRLGIPFSLKDNEGKAKINFEIVWKEVKKEHSVGLSIGLPIGNNIF